MIKILLDQLTSGGIKRGAVGADSESRRPALAMDTCRQKWVPGGISACPASPGPEVTRLSLTGYIEPRLEVLADPGGLSLAVE